MLKHFNISKDEIIKDCIDVIRNKQIEIEVKRKKEISELKKSIEDWKREKFNRQIAIASTERLKNRINDIECENYLFPFIISDCHSLTAKSYYISKENLKEIETALLTFYKSSENETITGLISLNIEKPWLIVGVNYASGNIHRLYNEELSFLEIAKRICPSFPNRCRPYISSTINGTKGKNIIDSRKKLVKIKTYCLQNDIQMTQDFTDLLKRLRID
jgi:hypothetical protein